MNEKTAGICDASGVITNVIVVDGSKPLPAIEGVFFPPDGEVPLIGGLWDGVKTYPPPATPAPTPQSMSRLQFLVGLATEGLISEEDALAAATTGAVPVNFAPLIEAMPEGERIKARLTWAAMSVALRNDPLLLAAFTFVGKDATFIDNFFRTHAG